MQKPIKIAGYSGLSLLLLFLLYLISYGIVNIQVDYLWYRSLGYESFFVLKEGYRNTVDLIVGSIFFAIFLINLRLTERFFGYQPPPLPPGRVSLIRRILRHRLFRIYLPLCLLLVIPIMIPIHQNWDLAVLFFYGTSNTGITDPAYGRDLGFYLLSYPFYLLLQREMVLTSLVLLGAISLIYHRAGKKRNIPFRQLPDATHIHLVVIVAVLTLMLIWGFFLQRYALLYTDRHMPVFFGPGFIEMRYRLPLIWLEGFTFTVASGALVWLLLKGRGKRTFKIAGIAFVSFFILLRIDLLPDLFEKLWVHANPVETQKKYMQYNIDSTLAAYGLDNVQTQIYDPRTKPAQPMGLDAREDLANIPVWDKDLLLDVYNQLEAVRPYYRFSAIDVDRYTVQGFYQQVNIAAREITSKGLPPDAKTWENLHLRYTHGWGAVITPAYQQGGQPMRCFLCGLNMKSPVGIKVDQPRIYYGKEKYRYAIVPNGLTPLPDADSDSRTHEDYKGKGGIRIASSLIGKALFALYFDEPNIFFSDAVNSNSRVLVRRNIQERIRELAPFLKLDHEPYLVATTDRLYWIQDAYTRSADYPLSRPSEFHFAQDDEPVRFSYIRNSVKVVVDAYDGSTRFYLIDPTDPIATTLARAFPGFFRSAEQIPDALEPHLRYPRDLFRIQMDIYRKYHQTDPTLFYQESQSWQFAKMDGEVVKPYYLTIHRGSNDQQIFGLVAPMTPVGLDNLSVIALAGCFDQHMCQRDYHPALLMLKFPVEMQVNGPAQISALINQNPVISQKLTLWNQRGSEIRRGRIVILPIDNEVYYLQPVYLLSSSRSRIPQLVRVIVGKGNQTVIDVSFEAALKQLHQLENASAGTAAPSDIPRVDGKRYIPPGQRE